MEVLVNGTPREISPIFDNTGRDITSGFLKETINKVKAFYRAYAESEFDIAAAYHFEKNSASMSAHLPPCEVENDITYNSESDRFNMSEQAFKWWEEYAPKHNEVSALEKQVLPYMQNIVDNQIKYLRSFPNCEEDQLLEYYSISEYNPLFAYSEHLSNLGVINLNDAANVKSDFLREYAQKHEIDISSIDKVPDLNKRLQLSTEPQKVEKTEEPTIEQNEKLPQTDKIISAEPVINEKSIDLKDENLQLKSENSQLKSTVNKLKEVIDRTNAILKENPSLLKAFKQAKAEFMQKHNSEKQEHPIAKPKQENKPHKHSKR